MIFQHLLVSPHDKTMITFRIISALLTINITERSAVSALLTDLSPIPCIGRSVCLSAVCPESVLWQTADWIRMPFGVVSGVGRAMGLLDGEHVGGDALFENYFGQDLFY